MITELAEMGVADHVLESISGHLSRRMLEHYSHTRDLLPRIQVPTLLLWGDRDRRSPVHVAEQLRAAIPGAELAIIPEAGHLSNMEQPEVFNAHVRRFCLSQNTE